MGIEEEAETERRGEGHDLGGNCEWGRMRRRWSGRLWGSRSVTAEIGKGDHIFASARAHVA
eukprot:6099836-Prymnesium_polylepis.1